MWPFVEYALKKSQKGLMCECLVVCEKVGNSLADTLYLRIIDI